MSYKLEKPYTDEEYANFVVEHNHNNGRMIKKTETRVYALEVDEMLDDNGNVVLNPNYEAEQAERERARISMLNLTAADVERAVYKAKGLDFDDLISMVESSNPDGIDIKALKIELKANNFYRGNPYIEQIGKLLGFTSEQLDRFFETKNSEELVK